MNDFASIFNDSVHDHDLWTAFKKGDRSAFAYIYQRHFRQLVSYGLKIIRDQNGIPDCIQDSFVELWEKSENLANVISIQFYLLKSLLYKIIRNLERRSEDHLDAVHFETGDDNFEIQMLKDEEQSLHTNQFQVAINYLP